MNHCLLSDFGCSDDYCSCRCLNCTRAKDDEEAGEDARLDYRKEQLEESDQ